MKSPRCLIFLLSCSFFSLAADEPTSVSSNTSETSVIQEKAIVLPRNPFVSVAISGAAAIAAYAAGIIWVTDIKGENLITQGFITTGLALTVVTLVELTDAYYDYKNRNEMPVFMQEIEKRFFAIEEKLSLIAKNLDKTPSSDRRITLTLLLVQVQELCREIVYCVHQNQKECTTDYCNNHNAGALKIAEEYYDAASKAYLILHSAQPQFAHTFISISTLKMPKA